MLPELCRAGKHVTLHYCVRTPEQAVFLEDMRKLVAPENVHLHVDEGEPSRGIQLTSALAGLEEAAIVYCCGPNGLMNAVAAATEHWNPVRVRMERFKAPGLSTSVDPAFKVQLANSARTIPVAAGQSILHALRAHDIDVPASCEAGICGTCRTRYSGGSVNHKDLILNAEQRKTEMLICVSSCTSDLLRLEL
jgi:ferredoxin